MTFFYTSLEIDRHHHHHHDDEDDDDEDDDDDDDEDERDKRTVIKPSKNIHFYSYYNIIRGSSVAKRGLDH